MLSNKPINDHANKYTQKPDQLIRIGVDVRDLRLASTGTKTYLEEFLKVLKTLHGQSIVLQEFDAKLKPYWGHSKWGKAFEHLIFFLWKQVVLPIRVFFSRTDVLICTDYYVPLLRLRTRHLVVFHDALFFDHPEYYNPFWLKLFKWIALPAARRADAIIVPSLYSERRLLLHEPSFAGKMHVVHQGAKDMQEGSSLSPQVLRAIEQLEGKPYLLHVGVLEMRKNLSFLIRALHKIRKHHDVRLLLVGRPNPKMYNNSHAEIMATIEALEMQDHVVFAGYAPDQDLPALYKGALAYVFPSRYEGFGIPILEAFYHGVPVAVANYSSLPEIGGDAVLTFSPDQLEELVRVLDQLISNKDLRNALVEKGRLRSAQFTWKDAATEIVTLAKSL